jgi:hypothetical protein
LNQKQNNLLNTINENSIKYKKLENNYDSNTKAGPPPVLSESPGIGDVDILITFGCMVST